jgi:hypothetical protein
VRHLPESPGGIILIPVANRKQTDLSRDPSGPGDDIAAIVKQENTI